MTSTIEEFLSNYDGEKREWLDIFINYMREHYPEIPGVISYQIPTFKFKNKYIAFSIAKEHFTFHTLDFEMIEALKSQLPRAKFGKGSAKVPYSERASIPILQQMIHTIVARARS